MAGTRSSMAMARSLQHLCNNRSFLHLHRHPFSRHAFSGDGCGLEPGSESGRDTTDESLSIAERCKNIVAVNWRGQLTTVKPKLTDKRERKKAGKTHGDLAKYVFINGKALVWIPADSPHCPNLLIDNRASFIVGHTDPYPLMKAFHQVKKAPPHTTLVGTLSILDDDENMGVKRIKMTLEKLLSESEQAVKHSSPAVKAILEAGGHVLQARTQALTSMLESEGEDAFYQLDTSSCHFVDSLGKRHMVDLLEASENYPDAISPLMPIITDGINQSNARRLGLRLLCAWFLRVKVEDAYIFAADRWGLDILARVLIDSQVEEKTSKQPKGAGNDATDRKKSISATFEWRDLRLPFREEVENLNEFCVMLGKLERESLVGFSKVKANKSAASGPRKPVEE